MPPDAPSRATLKLRPVAAAAAGAGVVEGGWGWGWARGVLSFRSAARSRALFFPHYQACTKPLHAHRDRSGRHEGPQGQQPTDATLALLFRRPLPHTLPRTLAPSWPPTTARRRAVVSSIGGGGVVGRKGRRAAGREQRRVVCGEIASLSSPFFHNATHAFPYGVSTIRA